MLTSRPQSGKLRIARNMLPTAEGKMESRPGARQLAAGVIDAVVPWGNRLLFQRAGRLLVWDGAEHDIGEAGSVLDGAPFQALTDLGEREDRLYIADGLHPLYYVAADGADSYVAGTIVNEALDPVTNLPVDLPVPTAIAYWRSRLWISTSGNFVQHSQSERPHEWNPIWTIDVQGEANDRLLAIQPAGDVLLLGLSGSIWGLSGTSQYDFKRVQVYSYGCAGTHCAASNGSEPYWLGASGVRSKDAAPLSEPVRDWFTAGIIGSLAYDRIRNLLWAAVNGRALAVHLDGNGWGEIQPEGVSGVWSSDDRVGWYGDDGIWALQNRNEAWVGADGQWYLGQETYEDIAIEGEPATVGCVIESWPDIPNQAGNGRALLNRVWAVLRGVPQGDCVYTCIVDNIRSFTQTWSLAETVATWGEVNDDLEPLYDDLPPVHREAVPRLSGQRFIHRLQASGRLDLVHVSYDYRFAGAPT
jgi:hypothetical protein